MPYGNCINYKIICIHLECMAKSASMKCRMMRTRGKNDSFRAAVDHSYNDSRNPSTPTTTPTTIPATTPASTNGVHGNATEKSMATVVPSIHSTERHRSISLSSGCSFPI